VRSLACPPQRWRAPSLISCVGFCERGKLSSAHGAQRDQKSKDCQRLRFRDALERLDPIWEELFPAEQARIVQLLVERVDLSAGGLAIRLRTKGLTSLVTALDVIGPDREMADNRKAA